MILRLLLFVGSVVLGAITVLLVELSWTPTYDQSDPNYRRYIETFDRLRRELDVRGATTEDFVDLSQLNDGEWKTACLFGGYTYPLDDMQALGANISVKDRVRLTQAGLRGFRFGQKRRRWRLRMSISTTTRNSSTSRAGSVLRGNILKNASQNPRHGSFSGKYHLEAAQREPLEEHYDGDRQAAG
jgi:hypothetical protein